MAWNSRSWQWHFPQALAEILPRALKNSASTKNEDTTAGHSVIDSLPVEILAEIFFCTLEFIWEPNGFHGYAGWLALSPADPPLSLLSVCKLWRGVALATPSLWDSIAPSYTPIPRIKAWTRVLPDMPFHLLLMNPMKSASRFNSHYTCEVFRLFATISHRWKSLSIRLCPGVAEELVKFLRATAGNPIPMKDLYIDVRGDTDDIPATTISDILSLLPLSTSVERLYWDRLPTTTVPSLPLEQLRTIKVTIQVAGQESHILSQCVSASTVSISTFLTPEYNQTGFPTLYHDPPFLLPILTSLTVDRRTDPMPLLQYFTLPSLLHLCIHVAHRSLAAFANFLKRTPSLETLIIEESGKDMHDSPDGPSERDIVDYLVIPELCHIPSFKLTFKDAESVTLDIIEGHPQTWAFPYLFCWREFWPDSRYGHCSFIGWGEHWFTKQLVWKYREGRVEFMPEYRPEWL